MGQLLHIDEVEILIQLIERHLDSHNEPILEKLKNYKEIYNHTPGVDD